MFFNLFHSNSHYKICVLCRISWLPTHQVLNKLNKKVKVPAINRQLGKTNILIFLNPGVFNCDFRQTLAPFGSIAALWFMRSGGTNVECKSQAQILASRFTALGPNAHLDNVTKTFARSNLNLYKGQLISKCPFDVLNSFKKRTNKFDLRYYYTLSPIVFVRFLEELKTPKGHLKINRLCNAQGD